MVHVIFAEVVLRKICDIGLLDVRDVRHLHHTYVHLGKVLWGVQHKMSDSDDFCTRSWILVLRIGIHKEAAEVWRPGWMQAVPEAPSTCQPCIRNLHIFIATTNQTIFERKEGHDGVVARCQGHHGTHRHECCASSTSAKEAKTCRN
jgi:hypothetical protein